jgi:hypothetical protein
LLLLFDGTLDLANLELEAGSHSVQTGKGRGLRTHTALQISDLLQAQSSLLEPADPPRSLEMSHAV